ncbi:hypothetical protein [Photobacterium sp. TY1-4]|uniref:hypothetical protein n=1 Tax=Photobacterium sp. TY1-4 TaxID=2899122 RepID=UPI0021BFA8E2|nr:hypothetical protein [Photobacterium sp. TY1-4]UXI03524.1 hypothetical protein NH461_24195 [Photobacterium sp. TY1-4]
MKQIPILLFALSLLHSISSIASSPDITYPPVNHTSILPITADRGAIRFEQVTFDLEIGTITNSDWGQFKVKPERLLDRKGKPLGAGFINVFLYPDSGTGAATPTWSVDNLLIVSPTADMTTTRTPTQHKYEPRAGTDHDNNRSSENERYTPVPPTPPASRQAERTIYFDLRPGEDGEGSVQQIRATILFSSQPLPTITDIAQFAAQFPSHVYPVRTTIVNAEGAGHVDGRTSPVSSTIPDTLSLGRPPQPVTPAPSLPDDLDFPIQVIQADQPNLDAGQNQCIPIAHANALQYLEDRYDNLPLAWRVPQLHIRGIGKIGSAGDVLIWEPEPPNSLVANIDSYGRRDDVHDLDTGGYTTFCGLIRGVFGYLADPVSGSLDATEFRHQGSSSLVLGDNADCDNGTVTMGGLTSQREGLFPTWEWIFDELAQGRAVTILFSWYDIDGDWKGGHSVRVYGAARLNNKHYILTLDDASQGDNFSNLATPRTQQWQVEDTGQPGLAGIPDGRLNMNGMSWEIDFALSYQAKPTLIIP